MSRSGIFLALALALVPATVLAEAEAGDAAKKAKSEGGAKGGSSKRDYAAASRRFQAALDAFKAEQFETAAKEFQAAFDSSRDPDVHLNIGESWEKAGNYPEAVKAYRRYLYKRPDVAEKDAIQQRIDALEGKPPGAPPPAAKEEQQPATPESGAAEEKETSSEGKVTSASEAATAPSKEAAKGSPPPPAELAAPPAAGAVAIPPGMPVSENQSRSRLRIGAWVALASAVGLATAGGFLAVAAQDRSNDLSRLYATGDRYSPDLERTAADLRSQGDLYNGLGIALLAASGATAIASGVLFYYGYRPERAGGGLSLAPTFGPGHAGVAAAFKY